MTATTTLTTSDYKYASGEVPMLLDKIEAVRVDGAGNPPKLRIGDKLTVECIFVGADGSTHIIAEEMSEKWRASRFKLVMRHVRPQDLDCSGVFDHAPPAEQPAAEGDVPQWCRDAAHDWHCWKNDPNGDDALARIIARHARAAHGGGKEQEPPTKDRKFPKNERRCDLIEKKYGDGLTPDEAAELAELQKQCGEFLSAMFMEQATFCDIVDANVEAKTKELRAQLAERDGEIAALKASQDDKQSYLDQLSKVSDWLAGYVGDAAYAAPIELAVRLLDTRIDKLRGEAGAMRTLLQKLAPLSPPQYSWNLDAVILKYDNKEKAHEGFVAAWHLVSIQSTLASTAGTDLLERLANLQAELDAAEKAIERHQPNPGDPTSPNASLAFRVARVCEGLRGEWTHNNQLTEENKALQSQLAEIRQRVERAEKEVASRGEELAAMHSRLFAEKANVTKLLEAVKPIVQIASEHREQLLEEVDYDNFQTTPQRAMFAHVQQIDAALASLADLSPGEGG